jgi:hypothetical protein
MIVTFFVVADVVSDILIVDYDNEVVAVVVVDVIVVVI